MPAVHAFVRGNGFLFNIFPLGFMVLFIVFVAMPGKDQHNFFYLNTRSNKTISNKPLMLLTVSNRNLLGFYSLQLCTKKIVDRMKHWNDLNMEDRCLFKNNILFGWNLKSNLYWFLIFQSLHDVGNQECGQPSQRLQVESSTANGNEDSSWNP